MAASAAWAVGKAPEYYIHLTRTITLLVNVAGIIAIALAAVVAAAIVALTLYLLVLLTTIKTWWNSEPKRSSRALYSHVKGYCAKLPHAMCSL